MDKCAENIPQKAKWDIPKGVLGYKGTGEKRIFIRRADKMEGRLGFLHFCKFANAKIRG